MRENNKKGFTIVELVIVIAVIAILAAVLIPNLSRLVEKANESKAMQQAKAAYEAYLLKEEETAAAGDKVTTPAEHMDDVNLCIESGDYYFEVTKGQFSSTAIKKTSDAHTHTSSNPTVKLMKVDNGELKARS